MYNLRLCVSVCLNNSPFIPLQGLQLLQKRQSQPIREQLYSVERWGWGRDVSCASLAVSSVTSCPPPSDPTSWPT